MNPHATAILLTADRQEFTDRAVKCFLAQTYEPKSLFVYDNGAVPWEDTFSLDEAIEQIYGSKFSIGKMRNIAIHESTECIWGSQGKILMHWDSDEWCAPTRMEEQVRFLIESKADCVGYNEMLFWREAGQPGRCSSCGMGNVIHLVDGSWECQTVNCGMINRGEAWRYRSTHPHDILGTSLCYWREVWERRPFKDTSQGEDAEFVRGLSCAAQSSLLPCDADGNWNPSMVATIHGGNTSNAYKPPLSDKAWTREPQFDSRLREICAL